ncbi:hypothetical protein B0H13DRAFT_2064955 [Mycena leptocephala]|nr:hypothetical protein B0H13DRAFT_2064955 [Mycena leptocephala]
MSPKEVHWQLTVEEYARLPAPAPTPAPTPEPPPAPQPIQNLPLPATLQIHPQLAPASAIQLDLSFPSDAFRRNPQLAPALLAAPACTPPRDSLCVRIAAGLYKAKLQIRHSSSDAGAQNAVTVGDILTTIQRELRQYDYGSGPAEAAPYMRRRIATVNGYSVRRSAEARAATVAAESEGGGRMFAGFTLQLGQPDHCWQLELTIPQRYAY